MLSFTSAGFATSTGFTASAGSVVTADALPKPSRSAAMRRASSVMPCMSSRLTSPPFTASPKCAAVTIPSWIFSSASRSIYVTSRVRISSKERLRACSSVVFC